MHACVCTHTHTHPTHISLTWKSRLHGELYHTLNQVTSNIWWRHILHSLKYKSWKGKQSGKIIWIMWGCLLAFHSISRGLRPRWVANGGGESPPFPHPLCAAQSCEASWIIQLLNTSQLLQLRHHQKAEISSSLKWPLVVLDSMRVWISVCCGGLPEFLNF